jgi:hypothetical protein
MESTSQLISLDDYERAAELDRSFVTPFQWVGQGR